MMVYVAYRLSDEGCWRSWSNLYSSGVWFDDVSGTVPEEAVDASSQSEHITSSSNHSRKKDDPGERSSSDRGMNLVLTRAQYMEEKERKRLLSNKFTFAQVDANLWSYMEPPKMADFYAGLASFFRRPNVFGSFSFSNGWSVDWIHLLDVLRFTMCYVEAQVGII